MLPLLLLFLGVKPEEEKLMTANSNILYEDQAYLKSQTGTALLDKFTHCLLVKCNSEVCIRKVFDEIARNSVKNLFAIFCAFFKMLDTLLTTLMREIQDTTTPGRSEEATAIARRFVRSVARIFVVFSIMTPQTRKRRGCVCHLL